MGGAKRPLHDNPFLLADQAGHAIDPGGLQGLVQGQVRHDGRQATGHHGLAAAGWTFEEEIMAACRRNFERPFGVLLSLDLAEVGVKTLAALEKTLQIDPLRGNVDNIGQKINGLVQMGHRDDVNPLNDRGLAGILLRHHHPGQILSAGGEDDGQHPRHRPHPTVQGEFADQQIAAQLEVRDGAAGRDDAYRNRQIIAGAGLAQIGRGQVDRNPVGRELIAAVFDRGLDPILALAHGGLRQTHRGKGRQTKGDIDLDLHQESVDPLHRGAMNLR